LTAAACRTRNGATLERSGAGGTIIAVKAQPQPGPTVSFAGVVIVVVRAIVGRTGGVGAVMTEPAGGGTTTGRVAFNKLRSGRANVTGGVTTVGVA
jgi:hypothetical protein